ncbi:MAG: potassium uptake protein, TrkH family [Oscillospiraceae bacterium]|nr:potassium uptake protein, TrkH family [Oscillospiraceae bacterium]
MINIFRKIFFRKRINPARHIAIGFIAIIFFGALILMLPLSSKERVFTPFLTALFTSTSATCVTGLTLINPGAYLSVFGQIILLIMIQTGGLGFMTILCFAFAVTNKRIGLRNRLLIAQSVGSESLDDVVGLAKNVSIITIIVEAAGALIMSIRFIPEFGFFKGLWFSIFHSVSAFCNAGFDIIGDGKSMISFAHDPVILVTLAVLVITGGLGFIVWEELLKKKSWKKISMYSRVILSVSAVLLILGTVVYFILEYNNPDTIGNCAISGKLLSSFFQSVTTRTAGFDAINQRRLTDLSKIWGTVLMMIGGASASTAGGIKTGTFALVIMTLYTVLRAKSDVVIAGRRIKPDIILHAMALLILWLLFVIAGSLLIAYIDNQPVIDAIYETASAYSTVGLTVGISESASVFTKILLIIYMFFGRVGILTISVMFMVRSAKETDIEYPDGKFIVG